MVEQSSYEPYDPQSEAWGSYLKLWGTRGSIPVSGPEHSRYGGDTSCLEIRLRNQLIIIDAGTGIRSLGQQLLESPYREVHIFIGHNHWDHVIGFPFFRPLHHPEFSIHVHGASHEGIDPEGALHSILQPERFPVRLEQLKANIDFHTFGPGNSVKIGDVTVNAIECDHPGGALGFRIDLPDGKKVGYVTDHEFLKGYLGSPKDITISSPLVQPYREVIDFFSGCTPLIHEAQYTLREYRSRIGWGHSSIPNSSVLMRLCNIKEWLITHHDPGASDSELTRRLYLHMKILQDTGIECHVRHAFDGLMMPL